MDPPTSASISLTQRTKIVVIATLFTKFIMSIGIFKGTGDDTLDSITIGVLANIAIAIYSSRHSYFISLLSLWVSTSTATCKGATAVITQIYTASDMISSIDSSVNFKWLFRIAAAFHAGVFCLCCAFGALRNGGYGLIDAAFYAMVGGLLLATAATECCAWLWDEDTVLNWALSIGIFFAGGIICLCFGLEGLSHYTTALGGLNQVEAGFYVVVGACLIATAVEAFGQWMREEEVLRKLERALDKPEEEEED